MGLKSKNADDLVQHYGERSATGEHKPNIERCRAFEEWFNDFHEKGLTLNGSTDDTGTDMLVAIDTGATVVMGSSVATMSTDTTDNDGVLLQFANATSASKGGLVFEARLAPTTAITGTSCFVGFTDSQSIEEPAAISGTTLTTTATDAVGFIYDADMTVPQWYCVGVDTDVDATGSALSGVAPVANTEQVLRIEVDSDGKGAKFFINGAKVGETTANTVTAATSIYGGVVHHNRAGSIATWAVDYLYMANNR